jgi:hypothetical protein
MKLITLLHRKNLKHKMLGLDYAAMGFKAPTQEN